MDNAKLCAAVVLLCVICPVLIGYAWPVGQGTDTAYTVGDPTDITSDITNGRINQYSYYSDVFNNNQNVTDGQVLTNIPASVSVAASPVWDISSPTSNTETVTTDGDGSYTISNIMTFDNWMNIICVIFYNDGSWDEIDIANDDVADMVILYPQSGTAFYRTSSGYYKPLDDYTIIFSDPSSPNTSKTIDYTTYHITAYSAVLADGFEVPSTPSDWTNTYENNLIHILFDTDTSTSSEITITNVYHTTEIVVRVNSSGNIYLTVAYDGVTEFNESIGSNNIYDYALLTIDSASATISLSALRGMESFISDYNAAIRQTVTADWLYPEPVNRFQIEAVSGSPCWYVPDTMAALQTVPGTVSKVLDIRDYSLSHCQVNLRSVQLFGTFAISIDGDYHAATIDPRGNMTISNGVQTFEMPINNLLIGLIDNGVYLNGQLFYQSASQINSCDLYFTGQWLITMVYYPVTAESVPYYSWLPGGFGLDVSGFCSVGLITSALSAIGCAMYGRRSGTRTAAVTITAAFCGAVYMILLMGGL